MSLNGLEKITGRILSDAEEKANAILAEAAAECERISAEYAARAEQIRATLTAEAEAQSVERISRIKSAAATAKRNSLMQTKSELIDGVFASALEQTLQLETEKYATLLTGLLCAALLEQAESEATNLALYGKEETGAPDAYEVLMNQRDKDRCGKAVIDGAKARLSGKVSAAQLAKLRLCERPVAIDGGLILRCGSVEANCSLSLLFASLREDLEADVMHALFQVKAPQL